MEKRNYLKDSDTSDEDDSNSSIASESEYSTEATISAIVSAIHSKSMNAAFSRSILRRVIGQICQTMGWHSIHSTPLDLLVDVLQRHILELARQTHRYSELYERTEPNLDDVGLAFNNLKVSLSDLGEYIQFVDPVPCAVDIPQYPLPKESHLNFLKPGSNEVLTRRMHVFEYMPPIDNLREGDEADANRRSPTTASSAVELSTSDEAMLVDIESDVPVSIESSNQAFSSGSNVSVRPRPFGENFTTAAEREGRPTRDLQTVIMTSTGFLSTFYEGKLPASSVAMERDNSPSPPVSPIRSAPRNVSPPHESLNAALVKIRKRNISERPRRKDPKPRKKSEFKHEPSSTEPSSFNNHKTDRSKTKRTGGRLKRPLPGDDAKLPPKRFNRISTESSPVSKLNIFKKIPTTKSKDEQPPLPPLPPQTPLTSTSDISMIEEVQSFTVASENNSAVLPAPSTSLIVVDVNMVSTSTESLDKPVTPGKRLKTLKTIDLTKTKKRRKMKGQRDEKSPPKKKTKFPMETSDDPLAEFNYMDESSPKASCKTPDLYPETVGRSASPRSPGTHAHSYAPPRGGRSTFSPDATNNVMFPFLPFPSGPGLIPNANTLFPMGRATPFALGPDKHALVGGSASKMPPHSLFANFPRPPQLIEYGGDELSMASTSKTNRITPTEQSTSAGGAYDLNLPERELQKLKSRNLSNVAPLISSEFDMHATAAGGPYKFGTAVSSSVSPGVDTLTKVAEDLKKLPPPMTNVRDRLDEDKNWRDNTKNIIDPDLLTPSLSKASLLSLQPCSSVSLLQPSSLLSSSPQPSSTSVQTSSTSVQTSSMSLDTTEMVFQSSVPVVVSDTDIVSSGDKRKDKEHRKEKKDKEKGRKKKDKKEKLKSKEKGEKKREKLKVKEKIKKDKKEKRKEKCKNADIPQVAADGSDSLTESDAKTSTVPKLKLKISVTEPQRKSVKGHKDKVRSSDTDLGIGAMVLSPLSTPCITTTADESLRSDPAPELARISALVTRPPKQPKHNKNSGSKGTKHLAIKLTTSAPQLNSTSSSRAATSGSAATGTGASAAGHADGVKLKSTSDTVAKVEPIAGSSNAMPIRDADGNRIWICPACGRADDGTPMVGCDGCDAWYHWACVGMVEAPLATVDWYCRVCLALKNEKDDESSERKKKRKRRERKDH